MKPFRLCWSFVRRMVAWMIFCGVTVGVLIAVLIEILVIVNLGYRGGAEAVIGALGLGALLDGIFGALPGVLCGVGVTALTLAYPRLPESTSRYRIIAAGVCTGVLLVPAGLLALFANDYGGVGPMLFIPTYFQVIGIPLIISVPFAALGAQKVAKTFSLIANAGS